MCPVCSADGANAGSECEANIVNKPCLKTNPVCSLTVSGPSSLYKFRDRECLSREDYDDFKAECKRYEDCVMAMCDKSGCKAEIPASGIRLYFLLFILTVLSMIKDIVAYPTITEFSVKLPFQSNQIKSNQISGVPVLWQQATKIPISAHDLILSFSHFLVMKYS